MDRTELLSIYVSRGINSLSQIKNKIVSDMAIATNGDLVITYNDSEQVRVPRRSASGQSVHISQITVSEPLNTLIVTDSNGLQYQLGELSSPAIADGIVGSGVFLGKVNGKLLFKPLVFSSNFLEVDGLFGVAIPEGARIGSNYVRAQSLDHGFSTSTNTWRSRPFTSLETDLPGAALSGSSIQLPAGKYWVSAKAPSYQTNNSSIRLIDTASTLVQGGQTYALAMTSGVDSQVPLTGYFELATTSLVTLQTMHQTSQSRVSWGRCSIEFWRL